MICECVECLCCITWKSDSEVSQGFLVAGEATPWAAHTRASPMVKCSSNCFAYEQELLINVSVLPVSMIRGMRVVDGCPDTCTARAGK